MSNFQINFDDLTPVKNVNSRVQYDLRYSAKTNRFNLSQSAYDKYNLADNGFNLFRDGEYVIFQVVPNEEATLHSGRSDKTKGKVFTADSLVAIMNLIGTTEFLFNETNHNGMTYLVLEEINNTSINLVAEEHEEQEEEYEIEDSEDLL